MKEQTLQELKDMVCKIIDMNWNDNFMYSPSLYFYADMESIVSCFITNKDTGKYKYVQDFNGNIFKEIERIKKELS